MSDYLTPQEQSTAIQLMYLRQLYPVEYAALVRESKSREPQFHAVLGELETACAEYNAAVLAGGMGWSLKKAFKKLGNVLKKANPVYIASRILPKSIRTKLSRFEKRHRSEIKKIGAAVAIAGGGFLFAPSIMAGAAKLGTIAKAGIAKLAANLGVKVPDGAMAEIGDLIPSEKEIADKLGSEAVSAIEKYGKKKLRDLANRYTNNGQNPFNGPTDPRLMAATQDVLTALAPPSNQPDTGAINAAVIGSSFQDAASNTDAAFKGAPGMVGVNPVYLVGGALALILLARK